MTTKNLPLKRIMSRDRLLHRIYSELSSTTDHFIGKNELTRYTFGLFSLRMYFFFQASEAFEGFQLR